MTRHDDGQQAREIGRQTPVRVEHDVLLARMCGRREHDRTALHRLFQLRQLLRISRRRRHVELEVAGVEHVRAAERGETIGVALRLHQAHLEPGEQRRHRRRRRAPALERALRHPPVDDDHRNAALGSGEDEIGPEIGFHEQREARLPVIEEARHEARRVVGDELVNDVGRKAPARRSQPRSPCRMSAGCGCSSPASARPAPATASTSPTLAPWIHTSGPGGRSVALKPLRSPTRASSSLPRFRRCLTSAPASGVATVDSER